MYHILDFVVSVELELWKGQARAEARLVSAGLATGPQSTGAVDRRHNHRMIDELID